MLVLVIVLVLVLAAEALVVLLFLSDRQTQQLNARTPLVAIPDIGDGQLGTRIAVTGTLQTERPVHSPLDGAPYLWYALKVYHRRKSVRYESSNTDVNEVRAADCQIADATGASLRLDSLQDAEVVIDKAEHFLLRTAADQNAAYLPALIAHYDQLATMHHWEPDHRLTFSQRHLTSESTVYARGVLRRDAHGLILKAEPAAGCPALWLSDMSPDEQGGHFRFFRILYIIALLILTPIALAVILTIISRLTG